jgi:hypothetical protein
MNRNTQNLLSPVELQSGFMNKTKHSTFQYQNCFLSWHVGFFENPYKNKMFISQNSGCFKQPFE